VNSFFGESLLLSDLRDFFMIDIVISVFKEWIRDFWELLEKEKRNPSVYLGVMRCKGFFLSRLSLYDIVEAGWLGCYLSFWPALFGRVLSAMEWTLHVNPVRWNTWLPLGELETRWHRVSQRSLVSYETVISELRLQPKHEFYYNCFIVWTICEYFKIVGG